MNAISKLRETILEWRENAQNKALACNRATLAGLTLQNLHNGRVDAYTNILEEIDEKGYDLDEQEA